MCGVSFLFQCNLASYTVRQSPQPVTVGAVQARRVGRDGQGKREQTAGFQPTEAVRPSAEVRPIGKKEMKGRIFTLAALAMLLQVAMSRAQEVKTDNDIDTKVPFQTGVVSNTTIVTARYSHWLRGKGFVDKSQSLSNGIWHLAFQVVYTKPTGRPERSSVSWTIPGVVTSNNIVVIRIPDGHGLKFSDQSSSKPKGIGEPAAGPYGSPAAGSPSGQP